MIRLLIADDHPIVRQGLRALTDDQPDMQVIAEAADGIEAVEQARRLKPDVILLDLMIPRQDGVQAISEIKREQPEARILVLTSYFEDDHVFPAIKAGALGYLLKDSPPQELLQAIRDIAQGQSALHPAIALKVIHELNRPPDLPPTAAPLTAREMQVLTLVGQALSNTEIAERLTISERTVGTHISNILGKLHLASRTQAALYALKQGLAHLDVDQTSTHN
jgi:NarL family two-component system response regulator LiaR